MQLLTKTDRSFYDLIERNECKRFHIEDGEFIGIIGHTGSGKSTLIQHLNGLVKATDGAIYYEGENIYGEKSHMSTPFIHLHFTPSTRWKVKGKMKIPAPGHNKSEVTYMKKMIKEIKLNVEPKIIRPRTTPITQNGIVPITKSGCLNFSNCKTITV